MAVLTYTKDTTDTAEINRRDKWVVRKESGGDNPNRPWKVRRWNDSLGLWLCSGNFLTHRDAMAHVERLSRNQRLRGMWGRHR